MHQTGDSSGIKADFHRHLYLTVHQVSIIKITLNQDLQNPEISLRQE